MLVLSRRVGERTVITCGDQVIVAEVVEVRGDKVRLGFKAQRSVTILRGELLEEKPQKPERRVRR